MNTPANHAFSASYSCDRLNRERLNNPVRF